jgi:hypothetical protein
MFNFQEEFILNSFTFKNWPNNSSGQVCRYDTEPFDSVPVPRVIEFEPNKRTYKVLGCFCSVNCSKAFTMRLPSCTIDDIILQEHLAIHYFHAKNIKPALDVKWLKKFGGSMNIAEFRQADTNVSMVLPKIRSQQVEIPTSVYAKKDLKAEACIFGKCMQDDEVLDTTSNRPCVQKIGLQEFLVES